MPEDEKDQQQTEQTPKGLTVPVPKRDEFFGNLKRATRPDPSPAPSEGLPERGPDFHHGTDEQV